MVVNEVLADKGYAVGETLDRPGAGQVDPIIVGVAESTTTRDYSDRRGSARRLRPRDARTVSSWLVDGGPVSWAQVRELNDDRRHGRLAGGHHRPAAAVGVGPGGPGLRRHRRGHGGGPRADRGDGPDRGRPARRAGVRGRRAQAAAQPRADVGHRRHPRAVATRRSSAARSCSAASPRSSAWWSGSASPGSWCPVVQSRSGSYLGPFDVPWLHLAGIAGFGLLSAFLAALVPAYLASRQDVVAVLAGRRGDRAPSLKSPLLGLVLLGVGIAVLGLRRHGRRRDHHRGGRHPRRARHDPADPAGAGRPGQGRRPAAARAAVRRARRRPAPHPHRAGRRRGRGDRRRRGGPGHRRHLGRGREQGDLPGVGRRRDRHRDELRRRGRLAGTARESWTGRSRTSTVTEQRGLVGGELATPRSSDPTARRSWTAPAARSAPTSWSPTARCRSA